MSEDARIKAAATAFGHYECEDCWYSCPKSPEGCCNDALGDECSCGVYERAQRALAAADQVSPSREELVEAFRDITDLAGAALSKWEAEFQVHPGEFDEEEAVLARARTLLAELDQSGK